MLIAAVAVMIIASVYALTDGAVNRIADDSGTLFPSPNEWIADPFISMWVNLGLVLAVMSMMIFINKTYNIPRTITLIYAYFFIVLQTATPEISAQLCSGSVMSFIIVGVMMVMFSTFDLPSSRRRVFFSFFLISGAVTVQYGFAVYLPVFLIACAQMRILTLRTVLAALLGIITPWWILFGAGVISPYDVHIPHSINFIDAAITLDTIIIVVTISLTVLLALTAYILSLLKLITYNARTRACNGLLSLVTVATVFAMAVDFTNFITYLTLLNCCTAFFLGHVFVIRNHQISWIFIAAITALYYAIYIWRIFV